MNLDTKNKPKLIEALTELTDENVTVNRVELLELIYESITNENTLRLLEHKLQWVPESVPYFQTLPGFPESWGVNHIDLMRRWIVCLLQRFGKGISGISSNYLSTLVKKELRDRESVFEYDLKNLHFNYLPVIVFTEIEDILLDPRIIAEIGRWRIEKIDETKVQFVRLQ